MIEVTGYTPEDLLDTARALISRPDAKAKGLWSRAAAHLCRQALEASLQELWKARLPGLEKMSLRAQLACLSTYLDNDALAGRIAYTWSALSRACYHQTYELAPTSVELEGWMETVHDSFVSQAGMPAGKHSSPTR